MAASPSLIVRKTGKAITDFIAQKNYPCIPAQSALRQGDYLIGLYPSRIGEGDSSADLMQDLQFFEAERSRERRPFLSFWAVFKKTPELNEDEFEEGLWSELSFVSALDEQSWDPRFSSDPEDKTFNFSFDGKAYFIVGLHPKSSRKGRAFIRPAVIFNLYEQFDVLKAEGKYDAIVSANRKRDLEFQGSLNPMVERHGETWESIQYSGKASSDRWKCPFHRKSLP